jgi:hypothetical protein
MAGPWNLQGPAVDFSPLGQLYSGFIGAQDHARKQKQEDEAGPLFEQMLAAYGQQQGAGAQPGSLSALAAQTGGMPGLPGNGAAAAVTPKGPPGEREKQAFDFFVSQGHSPAAAAGIVGNLVQESGLNPGAINRGDGADGSHSIGIGQWNAGRAKALQQFAAERGTSVGDLNTQLAFVQHELSGPESRVGQQLRGVNDPQAAAGIFAGYERPRGWREGGDPSQIHGWQNRSGTAARLMAAYGGNVPANVAPRGDVQVASLGPVGVPPQAAMPTQNPNGGDPTSGFNTPMGQNVYGQGFNAPLDTRVPLGGPQGGAPSAPATMQAQAQAPDPRADMPSQNATEAQFYVPGAGGPAAAPRPPAPVPAPAPAAPAATGGGMQPEFRAALAAGLRNPQTRAAAMELWKQAASPQSQYDFQVAGDQMYRVNKRTGAYEAIAGVNKDNSTATQKEYAQAQRDGFKGNFLEYQTALAEAKRPQINNNMPGGEKAYSTKVGGDYGEQFVSYQKGGRAAASTKNTLSLMGSLVDDPKFYSGYGAEQKMKMNSALIALGVKDPTANAPAEVFRSLVNDVVLGKLGGSLGAGVSNTDVGFMQGTAPNLVNTKAGNKLLIEFTGRMMDRQQQIAQMSRQYAAKNGQIDAGFDEQLAQFSEANPLFTKQDYERARAAQQDTGNGSSRGAAPAPRAPAGPAATSGGRATATGRNGEKLIHDPASNTWVPLT